MRLWVAALCAAGASLAWTPAIGPAGAASLPPQGVYEQCPPTPELARCVHNLERVRKAGMRVVLNYQALWARPRALRRYMDAAERIGVKVIVPFISGAWRGHASLRQTYPALSRGCDCDGELLPYVVRRLRGHPALWGWYVGDELPVTEAEEVVALGERVEQLDPKHPRLYVQAGLDGLFGPGLAPFAPGASYLGNDIFTIGTSFSPTLVTSTMQHAARQAATLKRRFVAVLQTFAWYQVPDRPKRGVVKPRKFPTARQMIRQRNETLKVSSPALLLWYSLQDVDGAPRPKQRMLALTRAVRAPAPPGSGT